MKEVLLLTATIAPRAATRYLARTDAQARLGDYKAALSFYAAQVRRGVFDRIVFVENSEYPLAELRRLAMEDGLGSRIDLLTVPATIGPESSRFALELDLLRGWWSSTAADDRSTRYWKVTGRYVVENISKLVQGAPPDATGYFHSRNHPIPWTEFFVAAFTRSCFEDLFLTHQAKLGTHDNGEEPLYDLVVRHPPDGQVVVPRMRQIPKVTGVRGFDGRQYSDMKGRVGHAVRSVVARVAPGVWL